LQITFWWILLLWLISCCRVWLFQPPVSVVN
jgi:hypothetical protein